MSNDLKVYKFSLPKEQDTIDLMNAFADSVFCKSPVDFSKPENVLTISFNGEQGVGKTVCAKIFMEAAGVVPEIGWRKFFKEYELPLNKSLIRHIDAKGLAERLFGFPTSNEMDFLKDRKAGGAELVECGNSGDSFQIYKKRKDKSFTFNGYDYDYEFYLDRKHATHDQIEAWRKNPTTENLVAISPLFQPRTLTLICPEKNTVKSEFQTFLKQVQHLRAA